MGLDGKVLDWIKSYLANRQQNVWPMVSHLTYVKYRQGVPQGSILGPLLYLIYADDLKNIVKKCGYAFYADDTVLYSIDNNFAKAKRNMVRNLTAINKWCKVNGIYTNTTKTKYMIFGSKHTLAKVEDFNMRVGGPEIERVLSYTYLGITLDPSMTLKKHVNKVINRVTNRVKQLTSTFLTNKAVLLVYKNMILLVMEHGYIFLSAATKANRDKLQTLQNKALHIIHNVDKYHNSEILQKESNLMRLKHRREIHLHNFMFTLKDDLRMKKAGGRLGVKLDQARK